MNLRVLKATEPFVRRTLKYRDIGSNVCAGLNVSDVVEDAEPFAVTSCIVYVTILSSFTPSIEKIHSNVHEALEAAVPLARTVISEYYEISSNIPFVTENAVRPVGKLKELSGDIIPSDE